MTAGAHDITIEQGTTWQLAATWKPAGTVPADLTGYTARLHMRERPTSATALVSLTTENGGISLGTLDGSILIGMTAAATAAIAWRRGRYDLELISPAGAVTRLLEGSVTVSPEVTR